MTSSWATTGLSAAVILVASVVHGIAGFAQVSMGLMPLFRSPSSASIIFTATAVLSNARVWWSVRDAFDWEKWLVPVGGLVVGMPLGIYVFSDRAICGRAHECGQRIEVGSSPRQGRPCGRVGTELHGNALAPAAPQLVLARPVSTDV